MQLRKTAKLLLLLVLALALLTACGGDDEGDDSDNDDNAVNLSQSLTIEIGEGESFTLHYPDGWVGEASEFGEIFVANNQAIIDNASNPDFVPASGEVGASANVIPADMYTNFGFSADIAPADAVDGFIALSLSDDDNQGGTTSDPETFDANGHPAAIITGTMTVDDFTAGMILIVVGFDDGLGFITFFMVADEIDNYTDIARAMAGQMTFTSAQ